MNFEDKDFSKVITTGVIKMNQSNQKLQIVP